MGTDLLPGTPHDELEALLDTLARAAARFADLAARVRDPEARVDRSEPERSIATLAERAADPVAFLLVAYGRRSQWTEIARARLLAWGRRPWLALRLTSYLVRP